MNYLYSFRALRTGGPKLRTIDTKFPTFCKEGLHVRGGPYLWAERAELLVAEGPGTTMAQNRV